MSSISLQHAAFNNKSCSVQDSSKFTIVNKRYRRHDKQDKKKRPDVCWEEQRTLGVGSGGVCRQSRDLKTSREFCSKEVSEFAHCNRTVLQSMIVLLLC